MGKMTIIVVAAMTAGFLLAAVPFILKAI